MELSGLDEHRMILRALQEAADHLEIGMAVLRVSQPEAVIYVNQGAAKIFGRSVAELEAGSPFGVIAPEHLVQQRARLAERGLGDAPPIVFESLAQRPDGTRVPIEVAISRVVTSLGTLNVTFLRDITTRLEVLETLRRSEERFRRVVESAPDGVAIIQRGRIVFLNELAARLLGIGTPQQGLGTLLADHLLPEDAAVAGERMGRMVRGEKVLDPMEYRAKTHPERIVEIKSILIDHEGAPAVLAFARDVSARKRIEQELVRADRLSSIGMMSAAVSHEINNPLAYVQLCLQYLERELPAVLAADQRERMLDQVRNAKHGIDRVATIVRDLRSFARDTGNTGSVEVVPCIEQAIKLVDNEIRRRARLVRDFQPVPPVGANASRLEQVFVNLLVNAAQAIGTGDVARNEIRITVRPEAASVVIAVSDTGSGIAPELRERIFEPFFSTKAVGVGTGLGLAVCRSIVEQFGGRIEVGGAEPRGAIITVTLPAQRESRTPAPASPEPGRRRKILIVDDEPLVRRALATVLGAHHDVVLAENGKHALAQLATHPVDVIVCDVMMPVMNGKELYEHLRAHQPALARRLVFITGGSLGSVTGFLEQTDALILYKPFELAKVLELVAIAAER